MDDREQHFGVDRRAFLRRASTIAIGSVAARGVYEVLDQFAGGPPRAEAAVIRRFQEQYLIDQVEVIVDNGVTVAIPPLHNDVFTARLRSGITWTGAALKAAKTRVENAIAKVEAPYPSTAAGLTIVVGWGLPYFRTFVPSVMNAHLPAIPGTSPKQYAVLDAVRFPSDPADVVLEDNHVMVKFRSDSSAIVGGAERANIPSFETLRGVTDQWPNGYFAAGCAMHLSHLYLDIDAWYNSMNTSAYAERVKRMFSARTPVPADPGTVTLPNGPAQLSTMAQVKQDAGGGRVLGHNALLQQATRLAATTYDNYGRRRVQGTPVPLREDFNTLDDPFAWAPGGVGPTNKPGMHFVAFVPGHHLFHRARLAMDGVMPDGTNFRAAPYHMSDANLGINAQMRASHRQNYVIPPRRHRSFPLVELLT